jgi:hypothetical protein
MIPPTRIVIGKNGDSRLEGQEKSETCFKISDLAKAAGKIISDEDKEHTPVYQDVNQGRS